MLRTPRIAGPRFALFLLLLFVVLAAAGCGGKGY
jgi:predicted small lipoprotein YifL